MVTDEAIGERPQPHGSRRRFRRSKPRKPVTSLLPNLLTLSGMCCGLTGIHMAFAGDLTSAVVAILLASFFDGIDGRVARKLGMTSRFGAELDSLADSATFGISPAVIVYLFSLHSLGKFGWWTALLFALCMSLRLARFNTCSIENSNPAWMSGFAMGVPAPAGAYMLLMPLMAHQWLQISISPWFYAAWTLISASLLVSRIPTMLLKGNKSPMSLHRAMGISLGVIGFLGCVYTQPWLVMMIIGVGYLILLPINARKVYRRRASMGAAGLVTVSDSSH